MKKLVLLLAVLVIPAMSASANTAEENYILSTPFRTPVLSTSPEFGNLDSFVQEPAQITGAINDTTSNNETGVYQSRFVPQYDENMIPQNAAAKGEPIPPKRFKILNIRTKQRSQGNDYWNPGGKGNKTSVTY